MRDPGAGTAGWPYTGPPGDHFLWILECRSLADRDSLRLSLRGLGKRWSSGRQALGRHDVAAYASTHTPPYSGESYSPGVRTEYKAELALVGHEAAELTIAKYMHRRSPRPSPTWRVFLTRARPTTGSSRPVPTRPDSHRPAVDFRVQWTSACAGYVSRRWTVPVAELSTEDPPCGRRA